MSKENSSHIIRNEINILTRRLSESNSEKKEKISQIQDIKKEIRNILTKIKENKLPKISEELKILKEERDKHNNKVKELITSLKEIKNKNSEIEKKNKFHIRIKPLELKRKIEFLEEKIQTDVISFDKEKKIMYELKKLKSDFKNCGELFFNSERLDKISREIKEERDKANNIHNKIKNLLDTNKERNKEFRNIFKELDILRDKEKSKQKEITQIKENIDNINKELNSKLAEIGQIKEIHINEAEIRKEIKKKMDEKIIQEKSKLVENKIKNKVKLTTEDFLVYQSHLNNKED